MEQVQHFFRVAQNGIADASARAKVFLGNNFHIKVDHVHIRIPHMLKASMKIRGSFHISKPYFSLLLLFVLDIACDAFFSLTVKSEFDASKYVKAVPSYLTYWLIINFSFGDIVYRILNCFNFFIVIESAYYDAHRMLKILSLLNGQYNEYGVYFMAVLNLTFYYILMYVISDFFGLEKVSFRMRLARNFIGALICFAYKNYSKYMKYGDVQTVLISFFVLFEVFKFIFKKLSNKLSNMLMNCGLRYHGNDIAEVVKDTPAPPPKLQSVTISTQPVMPPMKPKAPRLNSQPKSQNQRKKWKK